MANHAVDLRHVRDNLGNESLNTTSGYLHSSDVEGHRDTEEKRKIKGWSVIRVTLDEKFRACFGMGLAAWPHYFQCLSSVKLALPDAS